MRGESVVIDCSLSAAWLFKDERSVYAQSVLEELEQCDALVPQLWRLEIGNTLLVGEKAGRITAREIAEGLLFLQGLSITIDSATQEAAWDDTLWLARKHRLTSYDASYLELALRREARLATLDKQLIKAARASEVEIFTP